MFQKSKTPRDSDYLNFIRSKPCCICGKDAEPHHENLGSGSMGMKSSDYYTIPLCRRCHTEKHHYPLDKFWEYANKDVKRLIIDYLSEYIQLIGKGG